MKNKAQAEGESVKAQINEQRIADELRNRDE